MTYGFVSYVYQAGGQGTYTLKQFHGQGSGDTFSDTVSDSAYYQFSGPNCSSIDSYSYSGSDSAYFSSQETYSQKLTGGGSYGLYEAGTYGQGSFALSSVVFNEQGSWTANSTYQFSQSQSGQASDNWSASGQETCTGGGNGTGGQGGGGSTQTGSYNDSGSQSENFSASISLTYGQHATNCFTSYQAGSWANGSYAYGSLTYTGSGNESFTTTSAETWTAGGSGSVSDSSSGISTSGIQGNYNYSYSSGYNFSGSGSAIGNYSLHEEGSYAAGSYNLGTMSYSVGGSMVMSDSYSGSDAEQATTTQTLFTYQDNYGGSANGQTSFSLSEAGNYSNHSWAITRFTESESTYANSSYGDTGSFTDTSSNATWSFGASAGSTFTLYGIGSYANGSFSFQTFNSLLSASISTNYQEIGHGGGWVSYSVNDSTAHSSKLQELGQNQTGNYTLTLSDSESRSFTGQLPSGTIVSMSASNSNTSRSTGAFSLAGGNPYLPIFVSAMAEAEAMGVGMAIPWWSGMAGPDGRVPLNNRITVSLPRIDPSRLLPDWSVLPPGGYGSTDGTNGTTVPGPNVGVPSSSTDEANLGLPAGVHGPTGTSSGASSSGVSMGAGFSFGPVYSSSGSYLMPPFQSPQQSPENGPYKNSFLRTMGVRDKVAAAVGDCFCGYPTTVGYLDAPGTKIPIMGFYPGDGEMPLEERSMKTFMDPSELGIGGPMDPGEAADRGMQRLLPGWGYKIYGRIKHGTGPLIDMSGQPAWVKALGKWSGGQAGVEIINYFAAEAGNGMNTVDEVFRGNYGKAFRGYTVFKAGSALNAFREWDTTTPWLEPFGFDPYGQANGALAGIDRAGAERGVTAGPGLARLTEIAVAAAGSAPNPYGKLGSPAHRAMVDKVAADIEARGLIPEREVAIRTINGEKEIRFMDVVARDPETRQIVEVHQVGRGLKSNRLVPLAREKDALRDVRCSPELRGAKRFFHNYEE